MRIDIDDPKPAAIVLDGPGEFLTGDGLRFCARHGVAIIVRDGPGRALSFVQVGLEARDGAAMIADVSPAVIQAQCAADPLIVAREEISSRARACLDAQPKTSREETTSKVLPKQGEGGPANGQNGRHQQQYENHVSVRGLADMRELLSSEPEADGIRRCKHQR